jgi:adenosylmethionine-8-amino-7-oxononanoate aminotransferase
MPFGFAAASGAIYEAIAPKGFVHGFTWSHNALGAAVALAALRRLRDDGLVDRSRDLGAKIKGDLSAALDDAPAVGDVRGIGMMLGIELVADRAEKAPFPRPEQAAERVLAAARDAGLLLYASTGHVDGINGDLIMLGPPFTLTDDDTGALVERTVAAIRSIDGPG